MRNTFRYTPTRLGLVLSAIWIAVVGWVFFDHELWNEFGELKPNAWGDFSAGLFAPLAVIWFIIAYLLQKQELRQNTKTLNAQVQEIRRQADLLQKQELNSRRDVFLKSTDIIFDSINENIVGIYMSFFRSGTSEFKERMDSRWKSYSSGDRGAFCRDLNEILSSENETIRNTYEQKIHESVDADELSIKFNNLLKQSQQIDEDEIITMALKQTTIGSLYNRISRIKANQFQKH